jgi:hypothetical protein
MIDNQQQCQTILKNLQEEINNLISEVHKTLNGASIDLKDDIQYELASQIALLQRFSEYILNIQKHRYKDIAECLTLQSKFNSVKVAMSSLVSPKKGAIILAKNVRYDVEYFINHKKSLGFIKNFFKKAVREWSAPTKVLLGLALAVPIYPITIGLSSAVVSVASVAVTKGYWDDMANPKHSTSIAQNKSDSVSQNQQEKDLSRNIANTFNNFTLATVVALAGALGSIISILIRLDEYKDSDYKGSSAPILVGFAKPLIGTAFGLFLFTIINSNILPIIKVPDSGSISQESSDIRYYFFFSVAFMVGFSERLAKDIIERTEDTILPDAKEIHETVVEVKKASHDVQDAMPLVKEAAQEITNHGNNDSEINHFQSSYLNCRCESNSNVGS